MTKEEAKQKIAELVKKYDSFSASQVKNTNEEATKQGFILPLFKALGWNTEDTTDEVIPEEKASNGRVDYAFKLKGVPQFYLEAKSLKADLTNPDYIKQAIDYAYYKGVTWAILTDFDRLLLFNAQTKSQFITLGYKDYIVTFDKLWLLSHEALVNGALDKEAHQWGALPTPPPIEALLYKDFREWREKLFNELRVQKEKLEFSQIDEVIQKLFNRLIFIRTCEDRNIEEKRLLEEVRQWEKGGHKGELIDKVRQIFKIFNDIYDSELFDIRLIDSDKVFIYGTTIESILKGMASYPFDLIDADVLGAVYEQYLGFVAQKVKEVAEKQLKLGITEDEIFKIISKKERRKEQGIYYTPKFVTAYIVKETVGRFIQEHSYNEIRSMKILDPACGSGSFLIRAYDELLNYHAKEQSKAVADFKQAARLTVLLNNIYGIDLDMQAVEIARLNLLLRTLTEKGPLKHLSDNIRPGNSLISGTEEELKGYFGDSWKEKHPFNWVEQFPDIMKNGGFDVVIGNPPYIQISMDNRTEKGLKDYLIDTFGSSMGRLNTFGFFIHKGITLLKQGGFLSFIVPNTFLTQEYYHELREFVLNTCQIITIATLQEMPFEAAIVENAIITLRKEVSAEAREQNMVQVIALSKNEQHYVPQVTFAKSFNHSYLIQVSTELDTLKKKIDSCSAKLGGLANINQAIALKSDRKGCLFKEAKDTRYKKVLDGRDIARYAIYPPSNFLLYDIDKIHSCKREDIFLADEKIFFRRVGEGIVATLDAEQYYALNTLVVVTSKTKEADLKFILGLMNSTLLNSYFRMFLKSTKRVFSEIQARQIEQLPIRTIDFTNPTEKKLHDDIVALVEKMLELNKKLAPVKDIYSNERDELLKEIKHTDEEIDEKVFDLYGITDPEDKQRIKKA